MSKKKISKFIASSATVALVASALAPVAGATSLAQYKDEQSFSSWAKEAITYLSGKGMMEGNEGEFAPKSSITRAEIAKVIAMSLDLVKPDEALKENVQTGFSDVDGHWSAPYIQLLLDHDKNILEGYANGTFKPEQEIRRDELAKILVTAFDLKQNNKVKVSVQDSNNWAKGYVQILASHGIGIGVGEGKFNALANVTREEAAVFIHRTLVSEARIAEEDNNLLVAPGETNSVISIMHNNDTHANLDDAAKTVTAVNEYRELNPNALLLHAGDVFSGTLYFNTFQGEADLALMRLMGYDAMTFGNHEFDLGSSAEGHQALVDFIKGANFPFVSSNVDFSADAKFTGLFSDVMASEPENGKIYNGIVKEINGEKVGIFGLTTAETEGIASPEAVTFEDYLAEAEKAVKAFEGMGVNKIIALTHIGYDDNALVDNDLTLAASVDGIDVIVGGHTHTELAEPVLVTKDDEGKKKDPTVIVQAYQYNDFLGTLDVEFDKNGVVVEANGQLVTIGDYAEDVEASKLLAPFKKEVEEVSETEIGVTLKEALVNPRAGDEGNESGVSVRNSETVLGNLITDGMLAKAREYDEDIILALQNGGGIRAAIDEGPISIGEVITVLPFGNTLATMEITGAELKEALEFSLRSYPEENGGFLHIAGGKVEFDSSKPVGERVVSIQYKNADGEFVPVEADSTYKVATNAFTAKGGDSYDVFKKLYEANKVTDLGLSDWENFRDYLVSMESEIPTTTEGRIVDINGEALANLAIHDLQGESHSSPYVDRMVEGVQGVVTYTYELNKGFYYHIQTPDALADDNPNTSEGIVLYSNAEVPVKVGDLVSVTGKVSEYAIDGYGDRQETDLKITQINVREDVGGEVTVLQSNVALPKPIVVDKNNLPTEVIDNDQFQLFDPEEDAIDFWESLEGMRVQFNGVKAVGPQEHGDVITVLEDRKTDTIHGGVLFSHATANPDRIHFKLFDNSLARDFEVATGDQFTGPIVGVVNYGYQNYKVLVDYEEMKAKHVVGIAKPETTTIKFDENKLTVAAYNLENFSNNPKGTSEDKAQKLARAFAKDMNNPDIIGVTEVQDNNGSDEGDAAANESYERLIAEIVKAGGVKYKYVNIDPENNKDGGAPDSNIRVGFLYNPERVQLTGGVPAGDALKAVDYDGEKLTLNPGRIDPTNEAFDDSRKPIAAQFEFKGESVIVLVNHWNSKTGDTPLFGAIQPQQLKSEEQRIKIATIISEFVEGIVKKNPNANIVSVGDFNDYQFSKALKIHEGTSMTNMINKVPAADRYTYSFQGNSQVLDHILVSNNLVNKTVVDVLHINADFTDMAGRASDHDPVMVQIDLGKK